MLNDTYKRYVNAAAVRGSGVVSPSDSLKKSTETLRRDTGDTKKSVPKQVKPQDQLQSSTLNMLWPRQASPLTQSIRPPGTPEISNANLRSSVSGKDSDTEDQTKNLQAQIMALQKENKRIQADYLALFKQQRSPQKQNLMYDSVSRTQSMSISERLKLEGQLQVQAAKLRQMQFVTQERDILMERVTLLTEQLNRVSKTADDKQTKDIDEMTKQKQELEEQNQKLVDENASLYRQIKSLVETAEQQKQDNDRLKASVDLLNQKDSSRSALQTQAKEQEMLIQKQKDQLKQLDVKIQDLINENKKQQSQTITLKAEASQQMMQMDQLVKKLQILQTDNNELKQALQQSNKDKSEQLAKLKDNESLIEELWNKVAQQQNDKGSSQDQPNQTQILDDLKERNTKQIKELNDQILKQQDKIQELLQYIQDGEEIFIAQKLELSCLKQSLTHKEQNQESSDHVYVQAKLQQKLQDIEQYVENGEQQLIEDRQLIQQLKIQIKELTQSLKIEKQDRVQFIQKSKKQEEAIKDLRDYIQSAEQEYIQLKIQLKHEQQKAKPIIEKSPVDNKIQGVYEKLDDLNDYIENGEQQLIILKQDLIKQNNQNKVLQGENQILTEKIEQLNKVKSKQQALIDDLQQQLDEAEMYLISNQMVKKQEKAINLTSKVDDQSEQKILKLKQKIEGLEQAIEQAEEMIVLKNFEISKLKKELTKPQPESDLVKVNAKQIENDKIKDLYYLVDSGEEMIMILKHENKQAQNKLQEQAKNLDDKNQIIIKQTKLIEGLKIQLENLQDYVERGEQIFIEHKMRQKNEKVEQKLPEVQDRLSTNDSVQEDLNQYILEGEETLLIYKRKVQELQRELESLTRIDEERKKENDDLRNKQDKLQKLLDEEKNYSEEAERAYIELLRVYRSSQKNQKKKNK